MADEEKGGALAAWVSGAGVPAIDKKAAAQALIESGDAASTGSGGDVDFLTFSGMGENYTGWRIGRDKQTPDVDAIYVMDPYSAMEGWTCWKGGRPVGKHSWSPFDRSQGVRFDDLQDHGPYPDGDGWKYMLGFDMFDADTPEKKIQFTTTSTSGKNVVGDLFKEIGRRIIEDEPEHPVMALGDEKFTAQGKVNGKPMFEIEGWVFRNEVVGYIEAGEEGDIEALIDGRYDVEEEPAPKPEKAKAKPKAKVEPKPEPEPEVEEVEVEEVEPDEVPKRAARQRRTAA